MVVRGIGNTSGNWQNLRKTKWVGFFSHTRFGTFLYTVHGVGHLIIIINSLIGRLTHVCVIKLGHIGSDNGLSPNWHQTIVLTNAGLLYIRTQGTTFSEIWSWNSLVFIQENLFENVVSKVTTILSRPQCVKPEEPILVLSIGPIDNIIYMNNVISTFY